MCLQLIIGHYVTINYLLGCIFHSENLPGLNKEKKDLILELKSCWPGDSILESMYCNQYQIQGFQE